MFSFCILSSTFLHARSRNVVEFQPRCRSNTLKMKRTTFQIRIRMILLSKNKGPPFVTKLLLTFYEIYVSMQKHIASILSTQNYLRNICKHVRNKKLQKLSLVCNLVLRFHLISINERFSNLFTCNMTF